MSKYKIGDKVMLKLDNSVRGYVSHVDKGQLFGRDDNEIDVHVGDGRHVLVYESEVELYE